jgi:predicted PurR-regulated permease PerM
MNSAAEILVIIVSVVLAIFLILAIILVVLLIRVAKQVKSVTQSAHHTVETIGTSVSNFNKMTSSVYLTKMATKYVQKIINQKKGEK